MVVRILVLSLFMLGLTACEGRMAVRLNASDAIVIAPPTSEVILSEDTDGLRPVIMEEDAPTEPEPEIQAEAVQPEPEPAPSRAEMAEMLSAPIYFALDSYEMSDGQISQLAALAQFLNSPENSEVNIRIEGHCDDRGTREYNFALGSARANGIAAILIANGVARSRISTISYGKERQKYPGNSTASRAKNRRGDLILRPLITDEATN